jgi:hypothetical protein
MKKSTASKNQTRLLGWLLGLLLTGDVLNAQRFFFEDFESLPLGPNVEEGLAGDAVWTKTPPAGWVADDSQMPGFGTAQDGIVEWAGWSFANRIWWTTTAGDQRRTEYTRGSGTVMIADPDEWDDAAHDQGFFNAFITTSPASFPVQPTNSLLVTFDSSWRPEARDDGLPNFPVDSEGNRTNDQTGVILVAYNGSTNFTEVLRWSSVSDLPTFKPDGDFINEAASLALNNPAGVTNVSLRFGMIYAANDWWWAIDNLAVGVPPFLSSITNNGVTFTAFIAEGLGRTVDLNRPITAQLNGTNITVSAPTREGDRVLVTYDQAPTVFVPRATYQVRLTFFNQAGQQLEETISFTAPGYASVATTPTRLTTTLTDTDFLTVNEAAAITTRLDGTNLPVSAPGRVETTVLVTNSLPAGQLFASGARLTLEVTYRTASGQVLVEPVPVAIPTYRPLPASIATALGTGAQPGMRWSTHQISTNRGNAIALAEQQLAGGLGPNTADLTGAVNGFFNIDFVNFEQGAGAAGRFQSGGEGNFAVADAAIPGIPDGHLGGTDNIATECLTFVELPAAGLYAMVVNSDDGFQLSAGTTNNTRQIVLGRVDGGRGATDSVVYFTAPTNGVYLFRLLWFEGGGGASVEWSTISADETRALVGGTQPGALRAFRTRTVPEPGGGSGGGISSAARSGDNLVINFTGALQTSTNLAGPFAPISGATTPYSVPMTNSLRYFRAQ